ncbi:glycosyltransferase family 61 protein [Oxalobacter paraformigenes]|uniref:Glycosyltransferase 61 catalytic domain-containing protein n=1 Tax=Oxalobacter paraformigenes TaxID=556268 RepID=C3X2A1_9BURK|nr:glycosyltransferase 61 family protein [Oxalobacter paraformigenes]EEO27337.2 hypothetical protein OFAG_00490 [Oxalobacter paraformigenes]
MKLSDKLKLWYTRRKRYRAITIDDFARNNLLDSKVCLDAEQRKIYEDNTFFYPLSQDICVDIRYESPECAIYRLNNVSVVGRCEAIFKDGYMIHQGNFNPAKHISMLEKMKRVRFLPGFQECRLRQRKIGRKIKKGIVLFDGDSGNYSHFLCNIVSRLIISNQYPEFDDFPILIDEYIGHRLIDIVIRFNTKNKEIILVNEAEMVEVEDMVYVSFPHFIFSDFRRDEYNNVNDSYRLSGKAMELVHREALRIIKPENWRSRKVYLYRDNFVRSGIQYNSRNLINQEDIVHYLRKKGFLVVNPAELDFREQVNLMRNAEVVVSPVGSALANMIFADKKTKFITLAGHYEGADYSFWTDFACALNIDLYYVLGRQLISKANARKMHNSYFVGINLIEECLERYDA